MDRKEMRDLIKQEKAELRQKRTLTTFQFEKTRYDQMIQGLSRLEETLEEMEPGEEAEPVSEL